jgi:hypothetical protein
MTDGFAYPTGLYYALPGRRKMLSALGGLRAVLGSNHRVVLTELGAGHGDLATLLATMEQGDAAEVLGHCPNCC